jgi:chloramphenicol O-acetyltransferase type B
MRERMKAFLISRRRRRAMTARSIRLDSLARDDAVCDDVAMRSYAGVVKRHPCLRRWLRREPLRDAYTGWHDAELLSMGRHSYGCPQIIAYEGHNGRVIIGPFVSIAADVTFLVGGNHRVDLITTSPMLGLVSSVPEGHSWTKGDITVGPDVWIGRNVTIMSGVSIGAGAVVGAHAVVASDVRPYAIIVGNPAKEIRRRFSDKECDSLLSIAWWDWSDEMIREALPILRSGDIASLGRFAKTGDRTEPTA